MKSIEPQLIDTTGKLSPELILRIMTDIARNKAKEEAMKGATSH